MNNFQNLYQLLSETHVFTTISLGVFSVFLFGISSPLLYLAGNKSAFLLDCPQITAYLDKTTMPEPIRLKILFLSFPSFEKGILSDYLKTPTQKPSTLFSSTTEQLKCEILERVNYNKNVAILFFMISAFTIFAWGVQDLQSKILGVLAVALTFYCIDLICNGIFSALKYFAYASFKKTLSRLDSFHNIYYNKFACGLFGTQSKDSPQMKTSTLIPKPQFSKEYLESTKKSENHQNNTDIAPPKMAVLNFNNNCDEKNATAKTNTIQNSETNKIANAIQTQNAIPTQNAIQAQKDNFANSPSAQPINLEKPCESYHKSELSQLLQQIKRATEIFDFDTFQVLSSRLTEIATSQTLTDAEHKELQKWLDESLEAFRKTNISELHN